MKSTPPITIPLHTPPPPPPPAHLSSPFHSSSIQLPLTVNIPKYSPISPYPHLPSSPPPSLPIPEPPPLPFSVFHDSQHLSPSPPPPPPISPHSRTSSFSIHSVFHDSQHPPVTSYLSPSASLRPQPPCQTFINSARSSGVERHQRIKSSSRNKGLYSQGIHTTTHIQCMYMYICIRGCYNTQKKGWQVVITLVGRVNFCRSWVMNIYKYTMYGTWKRLGNQVTGILCVKYKTSCLGPSILQMILKGNYKRKLLEIPTI